jgi:hypothetical protein
VSIADVLHICNVQRLAKSPFLCKSGPSCFKLDRQAFMVPQLHLGISMILA